MRHSHGLQVDTMNTWIARQLTTEKWRPVSATQQHSQVCARLLRADTSLPHHQLSVLGCKYQRSA